MIFTNLKNKLLIFLVTFIIVFPSLNSHSSQIEKSEIKELKLDEVVESAIKNYPKVLALYQEVEAAKGSVLASKGFFDVKLRQSYLTKTRGFYDGSLTDTELSKKNAFLGSEISVGYRKSFGIFENHETDYFTNRDGEFRAEAKFSLLQNSLIDESRLKLILSKLSLEESKFALKNIKNEIRRDSKKAYYNWIIYGEVYRIYKGLYELALQRNKQLEIRVKKGDLAAIILVENERNALNRKTAMIKAKQNFENSAIYLSLFYRNDDGDPIIPKSNQLPNVKVGSTLAKVGVEEFDRDFKLSLQKRADINVIKISRRKENQNLRQAKNLNKPTLDVGFKISNDISNEDLPRGQVKNEIRANFEVPIQRRLAKGEIAKTKAKIDKIKYEERLLKETVKVRFSQLTNSINNIVDMHDNLKEEVNLSLKLEKAEKERFRRGGSDFFLINLREQNTASAKISNAFIYAEYLKGRADYEAEAFLD